MNLDEYLSAIKSKTVAVVGIGVSNIPLIRLLLKNGIDVTACDKNRREGFGEIADELESMGAKLRLGETYLDGLDQDIIFRSPGIRPDIPAFLKAQESGSVITSEMEVFFDVCPSKIIAVTGSDGKTTTTTLISELLKASGRRVFLGGNIGRPLLDEAGLMLQEDIVVLELSSFQLMRMRKSPQVAVVTNLAPNHLDIHTGMDEYIASKRNIFEHQQPGDLLVVNADNDITAAFAKEARGLVREFGRQKPVGSGVFLEGGNIIWAGDGSRIMSAGDILIPGTHNIENYMAAIAAVYDMVDAETIIRVARSFAGVRHRIELVREKDGVRYYNDSIASSPTRTMAGLRAFDEKLILVAGGYDKKIPYDVLGPDICRHVKTLVLTGATADKIEAAVRLCPENERVGLSIYKTDDFEDAVKYAASVAEEGDVVLLSPASASFDKFKNFEERGDAFREIVEKMG